MRNYISFLGFTMFCVSVGYAQNTDTRITDKQYKPLHGKVQSIRQGVYSASEKFGEISKDAPADNVPVSADIAAQLCITDDFNICTTPVFEALLSAKGKMTYLQVQSHGNKKYIFKWDDRDSLVDYPTDKGYHHRMMRKFNDSGKLAESSLYDASGACIEKQVCKFDDKGNEIDRVIADGSGKIKQRQITIRKYDIADRELSHTEYGMDSSMIHKCLYKRDEKGNIITHNAYDAFGTLRERESFNPQGKATEVAVFNKEGNMQERAVWEYAPSGAVAEYKYFRADGSRYVEKFNEMGDTVDLSDYDASGAVVNQMIKKFDESGKLISMRSLSGGKFTTILKYDANGKVSERSEHEKDAEIRREVIKYDQYGRLQDMFVYDKGALCLVKTNQIDAQTTTRVERTIRYNVADGSVADSTLCRYDNRDLLIEYSAAGNGKRDSAVFKYDGQGNLIEKKNVGTGDTGSYTFEYTYDKYSNWTKMVCWYAENDRTLVRPRFIVEREITYYE